MINTRQLNGFFDNLFVDIWYIYLQPTLLYHFTFLLFLFSISFMNYNDQFKARNHIFMFMFSHRTFFQLLKTGYLSLFTFLALTSIFKYTTQNIYIFKSVKSSSSIHNRHNRIHYRLLIYILTYIRQNVCYRSFILRTKDISN